MQTFLPYEDFIHSAAVLDSKRLGKQRVEVLQILKALSGQSKGWINHPAVKMWKGSEPYLIAYGLTICDEWISRGYKDTCKQKIINYHKATLKYSSVIPSWLGNQAFHDSHKSNLMRKLPSHYGKHFGEQFPNNLPYIWPI